jgi:hypothetical protein
VLPLRTLHHRFRLYIAVIGCVIAVFLISGLPLVRAADRTPVGPPLQLSPRDTQPHRRPDVAADSRGNAVVVWQMGAESPDIFVQLLNAGGAPRGVALRVNGTISGSQRRPVVAMAANGNFVVAWDGAGPGDTQGIWLRRFNAAGSPLGADILVNTTREGDQLNPAIAMQSDGAFVVVWEGVVPGDSAGVAFRRFTAEAFPRDMADQVPYPTPQPACSTRGAPDVALAPTGALAIVWEAYACDPLTFAETFSIVLQRYDGSGASLNGSVLAAADGGARVGEPAIAFAGSDSIVAGWARRPTGDAQALIEAVRLTAAGGLITEPTIVSAPQPAPRSGPQIVVDDEAMTTIAWADQSAPGGVALGVAARLLDPTGALHGDLLTPALDLPSTERTGTVALATGRTILNDLFFVWEAPASETASTAAVYGRAYRSPGVLVNPSSSLLTVGGSAINLSVALATAPASPVQITLTPRNTQLQLANLAPGAPLTLTFAPNTATQPQVIAVRAGAASLAGDTVTALLDISAFASDPAYAGAATRIMIDGALSRTLSFTVLANGSAAPTPMLPLPTSEPNLPTLTPTSLPGSAATPSPSATTAPESALFHVFVPLTVR